MENYFLNLEKPEINFIKDKECLICLESLDLELNNIVKLQCGCANSVYHIICIETFLKSGENKNFCPHCKTKYVIPQNEPIIEQNPVPLQNYVVINTEQEIYRLIKIREIMLFHVISNSIMNIINLLVIKNYSNSGEGIQVLSLFYLCKIFINCCIFLFSKNNIETIENFLIGCYVYQIVLFGFLVYSLTKIKNNYSIIILVINNLLFTFIDVLFRTIKQYNIRNRVENL